jgi:hypothetical protein
MSHVKIVMDLATNLSPTQILNNTLNRLGGSSPSQTKCDELEIFLNNMIYGENGHSEEAERLANIATRYFEEKFQGKFDTFDFASKMLGRNNAEDVGKIALEDRESFQHSKYIQYNTVMERLYTALFQIDAIQNSPEPIAEYEKIMANLKAIVNTAEQLLKTEEAALLSGSQHINVTPNTKSLIRELDALYQQMTFFKSLPLSSYDIGYVFEKALQALGSTQTIEEMTDEMLYDAFIQQTAGTGATSRGGLVDVAGVKVEGITKVGKKGQKTTTYNITGDNGSTLSIKGVFDEKQGKMDVHMTLPGGQEFRASAKNWESMQKRDFGSTSLAAALLRSAGLNEMLAYGVGLGWPNSYSSSETLHNYAKIAAIADIVMGYSQESGYADTIIINDRSRRHVFVYSMSEILKELYQKLSELSLPGYNPDSVQNALRNSLNWNQPLAGSDQNYMQSIYSTLSGIQISVSSDILG